MSLSFDAAVTGIGQLRHTDRLQNIRSFAISPFFFFFFFSSLLLRNAHATDQKQKRTTFACRMVRRWRVKRPTNTVIHINELKIANSQMRHYISTQQPVCLCVHVVSHQCNKSDIQSFSVHHFILFFVEFLFFPVFATKME